jgi:peptidyl-prolyl cis-trans isomerase SurA
MTWRSLIIGAVALGLASAAYSVGRGDSVVAVVEGEVITLHDLDESIAQGGPRLRSQLASENDVQQVDALRRLAMQRLIDRELVFAEFKKLGGKVPLDVLQDQIDRMVTGRCGGDRLKFEELLAAEGMTVADFETKMRKQVAIDILLNERVYRAVSIGPERIEAFYRDRSAELAVKSGVRLQAIILKKTKGRYSDRLPEVTAEIFGKLKEEIPFAELAKTYSEGLHADEGGDQGWITTPSGKLQEAIQSLNPGDVTAAAVDLGSNVYIIKLTERRAESLPALDNALRKRIEEVLRREEEERRYEAFIAELRPKYHVKTPEDFDAEN